MASWFLFPSVLFEYFLHWYFLLLQEHRLVTLKWIYYHISINCIKDTGYWDKVESWLNASLMSVMVITVLVHYRMFSIVDSRMSSKITVQFYIQIDDELTWSVSVRQSSARLLSVAGSLRTDVERLPVLKWDTFTSSENF